MRKTLLIALMTGGLALGAVSTYAGNLIGAPGVQGESSAQEKAGKNTPHSVGHCHPDLNPNKDCDPIDERGIGGKG